MTSKNLITYSRSRIENVLEAIPEAVLILDQSGNISFANRRISTLLGVAHADVTNAGLADWCVIPELLEVISRYSGKPVAWHLSETTRLNVGDQKKRNLAIKAYPIFSPTDSTDIYGSLICFFTVQANYAARSTIFHGIGQQIVDSDPQKIFICHYRSQARWQIDFKCEFARAVST